MKYQYDYIIYDGLRQMSLDMFKTVADGDVPSGPVLSLRAVADTLELHANTSNPIGSDLRLHQVPLPDIEKVLKESYFELTWE